MTRWARSRCRPMRCGGRRPSGRVQNFEISGEPLSREMIGALASIKGAAAVVNGELGVLPADTARAIHDAAAEVARGTVRRPVPDRRVPDRLGDLVQHERQRGHRDARQPRARAAGPPERPRERVTVVQRRVPVRDPPGCDPADRDRRCCPRSAISPTPWTSRQPSSPTWSRRPDAPDGRDAGDARARSSAGTRPRSGTASSGPVTYCPMSASCRSAAPRSGPA